MTQHSWDIVHKLEQAERARFLQRLSVKKSFRIFQDLYEMALKSKTKNEIIALNRDKIKTLSKIHFAFQRACKKDCRGKPQAGINQVF